MAVNKAFRPHSRLLKPADFKRVFEQALVSSDGFFRVLARRGDKQEPRLGMAVSRKVDSRAVARNRIKRIIRESFREQRLPAAEHCKSSAAGCDYVVLAHAAAARASNAQLSASLKSHWQAIDRKLVNDPENQNPASDE